MKINICISSKFPNSCLYECVKNLYAKQINIDLGNTYEIHVVDSCSDNLMYYNKVLDDFKDVKIYYAQNKNYEYGAYKYVLDNIDLADAYFCMQDAIILNKTIETHFLDENTVFAFHRFCGYNNDLIIKKNGLINLEESNLNYLPFINSNFNIATHCTFIANKQVFQDIFKHLNKPPIDKIGSRFYERNFGVYFIAKNIKTINLLNYMRKIHGNRK
jgi:hypothetical protein